MTLIAGFTTGGVRLLLGDLIASSPNEGATIKLPSIGDSSEIFPEGSQVSLRLVQKIAQINEHFCVAWSGMPAAAASVVKDLRGLTGGRPVTRAKLEGYLHTLKEDKAFSELALICLYVDERGESRMLAHNSQPVTGAPEGVEAFCEGSGANAFADALCKMRNHMSDGPAEFGAMSMVHSIYGTLLAREIGNRPFSRTGDMNPLLSFYGGGYELARVAAGRVEKLQNTLLVFWEAHIPSGGYIQLKLPSLFIQRGYRGNSLAMRWGRTEVWNGEMAEIQRIAQECVVVPSVDEPLEKDAVRLANSDWPSFNASVEAHTVVIKIDSGPWQVACWLIQPHTEQDRSFTFHETLNEGTTVRARLGAAHWLQQKIFRFLRIEALNRRKNEATGAR